MTYKNSNSNPMVYAKKVYADNGTEPITEIAFNNNVNAYACKGAKWLKKVTFGSSVKSIGKEAFSDCLNLSSPTLPEHLESIDTKYYHKHRSFCLCRLFQPAVNYCIYRNTY